MSYRQIRTDVPRLSIHFFTWSRTAEGTLMGVAEASDLKDYFEYAGIPSVGRRVWDDAADTGFIVVGRTENRLFVFKSVIKDAGGEETTAWVFCGHPNTQDEIHIIND